MRNSVLPAFLDITRKFEGGEGINWLFPDVKNLVSTGMGLLLDPPALALALPWRHGTTGSLATPDEVREAWQKVKEAGGGPCFDNGHTVPGRKSCLGGNNPFWQNLTDLRLDHQGISDAVAQKLKGNENVMRPVFAGFDSWPADAQLGLHSLAWARGPGFPGSGGNAYPHFTASLSGLVPDFDTAARESRLSEVGNPGVGQRNDAQFVLFSNAARVMSANMNPDTMFYPTDLQGRASSRRDLGRGGGGGRRGGGLGPIARKHSGLFIGFGIALAGILGYAVYEAGRR